VKILIIGATSAIAKATARLYAQQRAELFIIGRDETRLAALVDDLTVRGGKLLGSLTLDLTKTQEHEKALNAAFETMTWIDLVLICHGDLPDQAACETNYKDALKAINVNALSTLSMLSVLGERFIEQGKGTIAVVTSVAGDRGRQPNYVYGAAKAMVSTYLQGFRGRVFAHGVHVLDVKPGLVDSPMTSHLEKGPLWSQPEVVAKAIVTAVKYKRHTIYSPGYWRMIMLIVANIPELIFKRLKF
jgi:decaprenylphospho-beta-D-erythro-pentofuranosid-2-ulose 2-reductase